MAADVIGTPPYVTARDNGASLPAPTATPTVRSKFDPVVVITWVQLKLEPLVVDTPPAPGPTASIATPDGGGGVALTVRETVAVCVRPPLTPVIVSVYVPVGVLAPVAT